MGLSTDDLLHLCDKYRLSRDGRKADLQDRVLNYLERDRRSSPRYSSDRADRGHRYDRDSRERDRRSPRKSSSYSEKKEDYSSRSSSDTRYKRTADEAGIPSESNQTKKSRTTESRSDGVVHPVQAAMTEHLQSQAHVQFADMTQLAAAKLEPSAQQAEPAAKEQPPSQTPVAEQPIKPEPVAQQPTILQPAQWPLPEPVPGINLIAPFGMQQPPPPVGGAVPDRWAKATAVHDQIKTEDDERRPIEVPYKRVDHSSKPPSELGKTQKEVQEFLHTMDPKELLRLCAQLCVDDPELFQTLKTGEPERQASTPGTIGDGGYYHNPTLCKLFIRGLNLLTTDETLRVIFEKHGTVIDVNIIKDKINGTSKGYGFITMSTASEATEALKTPQREIDGSVTHINLASARRNPPRIPAPMPAFAAPGYGQFATGW